MSYRGRVLVINNLVASMLWHKFLVVNPPNALIASLQIVITDFFWSGHQRIKAAALSHYMRESRVLLIFLPAKWLLDSKLHTDFIWNWPEMG